MTAMLNPAAIKLVKKYVYTQIKHHRNSKRVWLEGRKLAEAGFVKGARISPIWDEARCQLVFKLDENGSKTVSGRLNKKTGEVKPIIDLLDQNLAPAGTRLRVTVMDGIIICNLHHEEQKKWNREQRIREIALGKRILKEGSLCTGIGVSTYGAHRSLERAGIASHLDWVVDVSQTYLEAAYRNNPALTEDTQLFVGSIEEVEPDLMGYIDMLTVSLPCTGHSLSGKAKLAIKFGEAHPEAATSVFGLMQIVKQTNPAIILSENVTQAQSSATYHLITAELKRLGYVVHEVVLDGSDAGTLEDRSRYYFVAVSEGVDQFFNLSPEAQPRIYNTMGDIKDADSVTDSMWKSYDYLNEKAVRDKAAGKGFARQFFNEMSEKIGCVGRGYNKGRGTEPFWKRADGLERKLTSSEHAKAKLIPEMLVDGLSETTAHEGLGQSVLLPHVTALMDCVAKIFPAMRNEEGVLA